MKLAAGILLSVFFSIAAMGTLLGQGQDLSGTWVGSTDIPNMTEKDGLTLILKKDGSSYSGTITDTMGMLSDTVLEKVLLEKETLRFEFLVNTGSQQIRVKTMLKVSGGKMVGSWESEQGDTGALEMVLKK
jgi:hypothetical protein